MNMISKVKLTAVIVMAGVSGGAIGYALGKRAGIKSLKNETLVEEELEVVEVTENVDEEQTENEEQVEVVIEKEEETKEVESENK